jgi:hypothetical protein
LNLLGVRRPYWFDNNQNGVCLPPDAEIPVSIVYEGNLIIWAFILNVNGMHIKKNSGKFFMKIL